MVKATTKAQPSAPPEVSTPKPFRVKLTEEQADIIRALQYEEHGLNQHRMKVQQDFIAAEGNLRRAYDAFWETMYNEGAVPRGAAYSLEGKLSEGDMYIVQSSVGQ